MVIAARGLTALMIFLGVLLLIILFLVLLFHFLIFLIPLIILLVALGYFFRVLNKMKKEAQGGQR